MNRNTVLPKVRTRLPGPYARKWLKYHMKFASQTTYVEDFVVDRSAPAEGPFFTDVDGNVFLDFVSHVGANALGYNHPEHVKLSKMFMGTPDRYAGTDFISGHGKNPEKSPIATPSHLHHKLVEITKQFGFKKSFLSNSGAEAVENAVKLCFNYRRNRGLGMCFKDAFHGRTIGALSHTWSKSVQRKWFPTLRTITMPYCSCKGGCRCGWITRSKTGKDMSQLRQWLSKDIGKIDPKEVAYLLVEPMQGEGGYNVASNEFFKEIQEVCKDKHIPLICDEIQSGLGRSGKMWASEHYKLKPDLITSAKALQVGATIGKKEFFPTESGRLGSTWGEGNAHATAIGYTTISIIQRDKLVAHADKMGKYFRKRLTELMDAYPVISDVRGLGLMDAIEVRSKKQKDAILNAALRKGLLLAGCGYKTIRFLPPLNVTQREIDLCVDILDDVL